MKSTEYLSPDEEKRLSCQQVVELITLDLFDNIDQMNYKDRVSESLTSGVFGKEF